jgi:hypothetical protein
MTSNLLGLGRFGLKEGLRPDTKLHRWKLNFIFNTGGMGDFVNYAASTYWLSKNCPWLEAKLFAPRYLVPLLKDIHAHNPTWEICASEDFATKREGSSMIGPDIFINGTNISHQFLSCVGAHPFDVGFAYYAGTTPPPEGAEIPILDYPRNRLHVGVSALGKYAVIPTGNVHEARKVTGKHINPIIDYVIAKGLTPVFLGKKDLLGDGKTTTNFPDDVNYHLGLDLRGDTTVKQAACILQHAEFTAGLDCGLLHLAALMKDSKIIFGYNITTVAHREPRRSHGRHINITLHADELACIGCQSKLKQIAVHQFDKCLYGDSLCVDLMFGDNAARWKTAINKILED